MADHKHGEMDVADHEKTFNGFVRFVTNTVIVILLVIIAMAVFIT